MITSDDGLLDSAASTVASANVSSLRPPGSSNQRLPNPAENINDKFGKFEVSRWVCVHFTPLIVILLKRLALINQLSTKL